MMETNREGQSMSLREQAPRCWGERTCSRHTHGHWFEELPLELLLLWNIDFTHL
jgi:hypothetical protein